MQLQEKHEEFVVRHFACFMKLFDIIDAFIQEFQDELPQPDLAEIPTLDELMEEPISEEELHNHLKRIDDFVAEHKNEFEEIYGEKGDKKLDEKAYEKFVQNMILNAIGIQERHQDIADKALADHQKELRQNLSNQFRRLNIKHPQFPSKYRTLFNQTRDEFCANYRTQNLSIAENLTRELETLYGYQKQLIFQQESPKEVMKHMNLGHQILKTIVAHNAISAKQEVVDITPQNVKALEDTQKALTEQLKEVTQQLAEHTDTSNGDHNV